MVRLLIIAAVLSYALPGYAGVNSKEVGAVLIFPEYKATNPGEGQAYSLVETYVSVTNDRSVPVRAHFAIVGGTSCAECSFDLDLTGFQTKRITFSRERRLGIWMTVLRDTSSHSETGEPSIITACSERMGFIVVTVEQPGSLPPVTLGANYLHGDAVVTDLGIVSSWQVGAISVQGVGVNDGNRELAFNNVEYASFPSIVTANFWSPGESVDTRLVLFNVDFRVGSTPPVNQCHLNFVNAEETVFNHSFTFGCWMDRRLPDIAPGFYEDILGTANGFLWVKCDAGTHGALVTRVDSDTYRSEHADTMFQSMTAAQSAVLELTPSLGGAAHAPGDTQ